MSITLILLIFAAAAGFYVAWNIGANDVANAVGPSVGSGALTLKQAIFVAIIFEFCGAFFLGGKVSETIGSGIVNPTIFSNNMHDYVIGMLASLVAVGLWLQTASYFGWPVSTTHSIIGAVMGFGLIVGGMDSIYWSKVSSIAISWIISPLMGGALAYFIFSVLRTKIFYEHNPVAAAKRLTPYLVFVVFFILMLIILFGGLASVDLNFNIFQAFGLAGSIGLVTAWISYYLVKKIKEPKLPTLTHGPLIEIELKKAYKHLLKVEASSRGEVQSKVHDLLDELQFLTNAAKVPEEAFGTEYMIVERIFIYLQIIIACFMAFAHGSNDVANAIGPLSAIFNVIKGVPITGQPISVWFLFLGAIGIVIGLATWGWRVIETVGKKITELTPSRGFSAGFGAAITIVLASKLGLPISTTHVLVGAVLGVGFARGIGAINLNVIRDIGISWVITVPAGAILSVIFFWILRFVFQSY